MPVSAETLRGHIEYSAWANRRLLEAATKLTPDELTRDFATSDRTVTGTLAHLFAAERLWLARLDGSPFPGFVTDADRDLTVLQRDWPALQERWRAWASSLTDQSAIADLEYHDLKGNPWRQPVWKLVLHVVNHATHHRGQVSGFLRAMGHTPPSLDLILYYREVG